MKTCISAEHVTGNKKKFVTLENNVDAGLNIIFFKPGQIL